MRPIKVDQNDRPVQNARATKKKRVRNKKRSPNQASILTKLKSFSIPLNFKFWKSSTQKKRTSGKVKRRVAPSWGRFAVIGGSLAALAVLTGFVGYLMVRDAWISKTGIWLDEQRTAVIKGAGLVLAEVSVVGRNRTDASDLLAALQIDQGDNLVDFDPAEARLRVEKLGWVEEAAVMRKFPDEIFIRIQERRPFARWQMDGKTAVIDRKGVVVSRKTEAEFAHLPKVVGEGANEQAAELFDMLAEKPALFTRLQYAVRVRDRRWNLEFDNGVKVLLPEEGTVAAWTQLHELQQSRKILNKGVLAIDLRASDRMFVRLREGDAEFLRTADSGSS
ncbi:FtsQ-type POTRA domain-containing protein [Sneathiella sp. P13V-1]|uniref:cell division protein FtsQ/DivIB n=1 Tax=Sneathiella sp. P13V-1 TaxID=2697366 RepID=UPI00187B48D7|nr:cell division protein FtsQ/DivIB [Sneathiella sp. P13V-1]MBE7636689.1 FtsQ-type POTRA domain-containing protein [Sneathiella sp. P13V-1]